MALSDAELMEAVRNKNPDAFEQLMTRHSGDLLPFLRRRFSDEDAALDALQETWLRVWQMAGGYREQGNFRAWLFRVARSAWGQVGQALARQPLTATDAGEHLAASAEPGTTEREEQEHEATALEERRRSALKTCLEELRTKNQNFYEAVVSRLGGGSPGPRGEAAGSGGRSDGTERTRLHRATNLLRLCIERRLNP